MGDFFICHTCGNSDPRYIGYLNGKPYCRKCIGFKGEQANDINVTPHKANVFLSYELSDEQKRLSNSLVENYKNNKNSFVHAVCGSGKTEIILSVISYAIECGEKVGFVVPRRDVAIELYGRFSNIFKRNKVVLVCGGHHEKLSGDLLCLTCHQLFRFEKYFDLLILDEADAFPYQGNDILHEFFNRSIKGRFILMSATINDSLRKTINNLGIDIFESFTRFHKQPLPVPKSRYGNIIKLTYLLIIKVRDFLKENKPVFIFCPTIDLCNRIGVLLKLIFRCGESVNSKNEKRLEIINEFRKNELKFLVTTAILERGVTVKGLQVIVFLADHHIYNRHSLIQISGRVGRKAEATGGEVIFLARKHSVEIDECISEINAANAHLQTVL